MNARLREIAKVNMGLVVSRLLKGGGSNCDGVQYKYFTLSSVERDQSIDKEKLKCIETSSCVDEKFISRQGDIIIGISAPHSLAYVDEASQGIIIPSQFAVIRAVDERVAPEYLIAYLTSDELKGVIANMAKGEWWIKTIDLGGLMDLPVKIPKMQEQRQISRLNELIKEESALNYQYARLVEKKNNYYLNKLIKNGGE